MKSGNRWSGAPAALKISRKYGSPLQLPYRENCVARRYALPSTTLVPERLLSVPLGSRNSSMGPDRVAIVSGLPPVFGRLTRRIADRRHASRLVPGVLSPRPGGGDDLAPKGATERKSRTMHIARP